MISTGILGTTIVGGGVVSPYDKATNALVKRMVAAGETPSDAYIVVIDTAIRALKAASLFDTVFDVITVPRGIGAASTKLNWIENDHNLTPIGTPQYNAKVGYKDMDGASAFDTDFNPRTDGTKFKSADACWIVKVGGNVDGGGPATAEYGAKDGIYECNLFNTNIGFCRINAGNQAGAGTGGYQVGWNAIVRNNVSTYRYMFNATDNEYTAAVSATPNRPIYILCHNNGGTPQSFAPNTEIMEFNAFGKAITTAQFQTLQGIMNTYFSALAAL